MSFEQTPLNEFITLQRGFDLPKGDRAEGAVPVIASTGVGGYHNTAKVEAPGVVIGRSGSIGGGQYIQEPFWPLNTTLWVKDFKGHDPRYIYYLMRSIDFTKFNVGSGVPTLNRNHLSSLLVNEIGIDREKIIAKLLGDLDDKIALNTQTNQTLEQMAQAIFKSWFVDFDPVKAKMNGEQPEGMDAATASLFPEKLVESELGLIPEGWEVGTLDSHTSMIIDHRGKTPKKLGSDWVEEGYPAISAKNIKSKKIVRPDTIRFIDEATYKKWMKEPLIKGDIIMTSEAPMGELYFFDGSEDFCLSQRLYGLRANSDVCSPEFLFNWLQTTKAKADMEGRASGTTALGIKQAELRKVKILTPPLELVEKYSAVASNLVDMAAKNNAQNTVLEDLRETLLPKLLSGEIELG
ncbi:MULTISPECIES: restriction endonuclease subunit S [unclassified Vibrio]|uniref:restriction endonuclease subunit S n=1 Tax=unclassified Vibrio TaxID=2614977 RepID=UPI0029651973|nr:MULTISPECIES: restriction endonuclease subunit S [unclassified Vibrio]MDW2082687.1 restriction endonuclease subunit S [Vibrio sp. 1640]MDW3635181.1 restriction endonuclease subunit S [Vibrio sp. Vb0667]